MSGREHDLARTLGTVARSLDAEADESETISGIVRAAVETVPGVVAGGVSQVVRRGDVVAVAPSDDLVRKCDELQSTLGEGPCLDAIWQHETVIVDDMAGESRWPNFAAQASALGVGSLISFRLYLADDNLGALNMYGGLDVRFGHEEQLIGELFATHAAVALSGARGHRQMGEALVTRDVIGQAKGMLMVRHDISGQQAFNMLTRASQASNVKLSEIARWLVGEHEQPGQAPPLRAD